MERPLCRLVTDYTRGGCGVIQCNPDLEFGFLAGNTIRSKALGALETLHRVFSSLIKGIGNRTRIVTQLREHPFQVSHSGGRLAKPQIIGAASSTQIRSETIFATGKRCGQERRHHITSVVSIAYVVPVGIIVLRLNSSSVWNIDDNRSRSARTATQTNSLTLGAIHIHGGETCHSRNGNGHQGHHCEQHRNDFGKEVLLHGIPSFHALSYRYFTIRSFGNSGYYNQKHFCHGWIPYRTLASGESGQARYVGDLSMWLPHHGNHLLSFAPPGDSYIIASCRFIVNANTTLDTNQIPSNFQPNFNLKACSPFAPVKHSLNKP